MTPGTLDRRAALEAVIGDHRDFAIIAGLGNAVFDMVALTGDSPTLFPLDGVMGAAVPTGLGLALARPDLQVLVVTGDGETLMNMGALATVAVQDPPNLSVIIIDNGRFGLTGGQVAHTAHGTDIAAVASAAGIRLTMTCRNQLELTRASELLRAGAHASLVVLKVGTESSQPVPVERDGSILRRRFQSAHPHRAVDR
jgi:thiamine pyrophosphate-dependent acetolactate synthase large subunit-like protein